MSMIASEMMMMSTMVMVMVIGFVMEFEIGFEMEFEMGFEMEFEMGFEMGFEMELLELMMVICVAAVVDALWTVAREREEWTCDLDVVESQRLLFVETSFAQLM